MADGDGIEMDINPLDDNFSDDDDEVTITPIDPNHVEEIPPEVIEQLTANPVLKQYIDGVVKATINSVKKGKELVHPSTNVEMDKEASATMDNGSKVVHRVPHMKDNNKEIVKSPLDTTIYQPGLLKRVNESSEVISKMSNFVENMRLGASKQTTPETREKPRQRTNRS